MPRFSRLTPLVAILMLVSSPLFAAKKPLRIVSVSYSGKCIRPNSLITINLNKKIFRGYSIIAVTDSNNLHIHPKIVKWRFRANSIKVQLPGAGQLKRGKSYRISIERRVKVPHTTLSNKKLFKTCYR